MDQEEEDRGRGGKYLTVVVYLGQEPRLGRWDRVRGGVNRFVHVCLWEEERQKKKGREEDKEEVVEVDGGGKIGMIEDGDDNGDDDNGEEDDNH